jgi:hypothetical protein
MRLAQRFGSLLAVAIAAGVMTSSAAMAAPTPAAKAARPESCRLLRAAEITRALEQPTADAAPGNAPMLCAWTLDATETRPAGSISVYLHRGDGAVDDFDLARDFHHATRIKLRGLGQRAFYAPDLDTVYVLEDPATVFFVQGLYPTDGTVDATGLQSALVSLAGKAARRV